MGHNSTNYSLLFSSSASALTLVKTSSTMATTPMSYFVCSVRANSFQIFLTFQVMECYVNPVLSLFGLCGNIMSLAILKHSGIHKPSNILLFGLVVADIMCLMLTIDYALPILYFGPDKIVPMMCGFQYHDAVNYFLTISSLVFTFFGFWGIYVNPFIQVFVTVERLLAVFMPLTFKKIVTRLTTTVCVLFSFLFWLPWNFAFNSIYDIRQQKLSPSVNWMAVVHGKFYFTNQEIIDVFNYYVVDSLDSWIPLILVTLGTLAVFIQVKVTLRKRQKLTKSLKPITWSTRTTRTLMATSVVFIAAHACGSMIIYLFPSENYVESYTRNAFYYLVYIINGSSSLSIYLVCNKRFLQIFLKIVRWKT
ncbi:G-protein coupled receptor [Biomphalaria pfeifferi]|uniref:G-protein coupled receptor n=1 Tax=Biomphalaria pfeifferi TaxID=112525 RepID=A0AAD8BLY4_BIOPF|nr:G-protein coupled receptor [Biomphalaria pfeifferi]